MDLSMLRQVAKGRYGLDRSTGEDSLFTNPVLNDLINEKHRWFASVALCYYKHNFSTALVSGQSGYAGDPSVIEIDPKTVRVQSATNTYAPLPLRLYSSLVSEWGALEGKATGLPTCFWMRAGGSGDTNDQSRVIEVYPVPGASQVGASFKLWYGGWHYPVDLAADTDRPLLPAHEHDRLIPAICWGMAELERSRGRGDAPVEYWQAQAQDKALELFEIIRRGTREAPRTAQVGASPLDDARERRQAKLGGLARRLE